MRGRRLQGLPAPFPPGAGRGHRERGGGRGGGAGPGRAEGRSLPRAAGEAARGGGRPGHSQGAVRGGLAATSFPKRERVMEKGGSGAMSLVVGGDPTAGRRTSQGRLPERGWRRGRLCTERSGPTARGEGERCLLLPAAARLQLR